MANILMTSTMLVMTSTMLMMTSTMLVNIALVDGSGSNDNDGRVVPCSTRSKDVGAAAVHNDSDGGISGRSCSGCCIGQCCRL